MPALVSTFWASVWTIVTTSAAAMGWVWAQSNNPSDPLFEYGAIGILAAFAIYAVRVLFNSQKDTHQAHIAELQKALDRERERTVEERARGDRLEAEMKRQNDVIQERIVTALFDSTQAVKDAMGAVREQQ